jgi:hypothetical protein
MTRSMTRIVAAGSMALTALGAVAMSEVAPAAADETGSVVSTVDDPVGDAYFPFTPGDTEFPFAAPFLDFFFGQLTKTADGDFELLMEMAVAVPGEPTLPKPGAEEIWWFWIFDLDSTTSPAGYPWKGAGGRPPEFIVYVSWDGTEFSGAAIDRRPLLTGGEAIITPVPFTIDGATVEAFLDSELIGDVPASFGWGPFTFLWSGPVGSEGVHFADYSEAGGVFNP